MKNQHKTQRITAVSRNGKFSLNFMSIFRWKIYILVENKRSRSCHYAKPRNVSCKHQPQLFNDKTMEENKSQINREELINLHFHYESVTKDELDFFFKYSNFYIGLLSALLTATITGLLSYKSPHHQYAQYILLLGPVLIISLSYIGYRNVRVYYRRFLEAVVTILNIKKMLGYDVKPNIENGIFKHHFPSKFGGGFITQFNRPNIREVIDKAKSENWFAEDLLEKLLEKGDTLRFVNITFLGFRIAALILFIFILSTTYACS